MAKYLSANTVDNLDAAEKAWAALYPAGNHPFRIAFKTVRTISGKLRYARDIMPADLHKDEHGQSLPKKSKIPIFSTPASP